MTQQGFPSLTDNDNLAGDDQRHQVTDHLRSAPGLPRQRPDPASVGDVLTPGQTGYPEAAATLFATGTPEMIVRPKDAAEAAAAVRYATGSGLTISVRSGGHSAAGLSTHSDGMVIDLGLIDGVEVIDRATRRVRIGAGATWGQVATALRPHGLAITAGDTREVGVGGLALGGGIGWLVRKYGLTIDSLVGAEVVLADGRAIRVDATEHAELLWALRGAGGNFGVVTELEFVAQPVESVHYGTIEYTLDDIPALVRGWRNVMRTADENLNTTLVLVPPMMGGPAMALVLACYAVQDAVAAAAALEPLLRLGDVSSNTVRQVPYSEVLESGPPPGLQIAMRNTFLPELTDAAIAAVSAAFAAGHSMITLRALGGAVARVPAAATAFAHRSAEVMVLAMTIVPPGADADAARAQLCEDWEPLAAFGSGAYGNFLSSATAGDTAQVYPAATYRRLVTVKRRYDPDNVFRRNHNVLPDFFGDGIGPEAA